MKRMIILVGKPRQDQGPKVPVAETGRSQMKQKCKL
jgi:hypothetical protein